MTGFNSKRQMAQDKEALKLALEALELALSSHGVILLSDPPQDPWKTRGVEGNSRRAITAVKEALAQPAQEPDELTIAYMSGLYDGKKAEREACAKVCDEHNARQNLFAEERYAAHWLASAIRARGNT